MGGVDKGLQHFNGVPLALHALRRLTPQVGQVMLNANRNLAAYAALGVPVWPDAAELGEFVGPLAGFATGLTHCSTPYLLTVPCDTPLFPVDLAGRLADALMRTGAELAMASAADANGQLRRQPTFCLMRVSLLDSLRDFIQRGDRKVGAWTAQHNTVQVAFDWAQDDEQAFFNANTLAELQHLELRLPFLPP